MVGALAVRRLRPVPVPVEASWAGDFRLAIDPDQIVEHRAWRVARACALATIEARSGLVVVLGPPGTGKSLLLNELARALKASGRPVQLFHRGDMMHEPSRGGTVLVDEADRMDGATLATVVAATNTCHVLAALPRFVDQLAGFANPMTVVALAPLTAGGTRNFIAQRLAKVGRPADLLSEAAMTALYQRSFGIPRVVNMLAGSAIVLAAAESANQVGAEHVEQVAQWRDGLEPRPSAAAAIAVPAVADAVVAAPQEAPEVGEEPQPTPRHRPRFGRIAIVTLAAWTVAMAGVGLYRTIAPSQPITVDVVVDAAPGDAAPAPAIEPVTEVAELPQPAVEIVELGDVAPAAGPAPAAASVASAPPVVADPSPPVAEMPPSAPREPEPVPEPAPDTVAAVAVAVPAPIAPPPAVIPAVVPVALPAMPVARVRIQYPRGDAQAETRAVRLVDGLRAGGVLVEAVAAAPAATRPGIRYFFAEDRDAATEVARRLEDFAGDIRLTPSARREALRRPGTIEVVLSAK
jgi:hypothetical protein